MKMVVQDSEKCSLYQMGFDNNLNKQLLTCKSSLGKFSQLLVSVGDNYPSCIRIKIFSNSPDN